MRIIICGRNALSYRNILTQYLNITKTVIKVTADFVITSSTLSVHLLLLKKTFVGKVLQAMWKKRHRLSPKILSHSQLPPLGCIPAPVWPCGLTDNPGETFRSTLDSLVRREENVLQLAAFRALAPITVFTLKYTFCIYHIYRKNVKTKYRYNIL